MNEKKLKRDISSYRMLELFCIIAAFGCIVAGFYVARFPSSSDSSTVATLIFSVGLFVIAISTFCIGLLALLVRRQAEHALYFKELITAGQDEGRLAASPSDTTPLRKVA